MAERNHKIPKLVPLDEKTIRQIKVASNLLGVPPTAYVRLAIHRSFEQILPIYQDRVTESARRYVERESGALFQSPTKRGLARHEFGTAGYEEFQARLNAVLQELDNPRVAVKLAMAAVNFSRTKTRHNPRTWGEPKYHGGTADQNSARIILGSDEDCAKILFGDKKEDWKRKGLAKAKNFRLTTMRDVKEQMAHYWIDLVKSNAGEWAAIYLMRNRVKAIAFARPDRESVQEASNRKHLLGLEKAKKANAQGRDLSAGLKRQLQDLSPLVWEKWGTATQDERDKMLTHRIDLIEYRQSKLAKMRRERQKSMAAVVNNPEIWDNPASLKKILWECMDQEGVMGRKDIFPADF